MFQATKAVKTIFYINVIAFLLTLVAPGFFYSTFAIWPGSGFHYHQLITHQFMHGVFMHILFNMLVFLSFGPTVENYYGTKKMWIFYLLAGLSGAILHLAMTTGSNPLVGASGAIWGVMMMFTMLYPNDRVYIFLIPYGIRAKYVIGALFLIEVISAVVSHDNVSHYGHIGGGLMGLLLFFQEKYKLIDIND